MKKRQDISNSSMAALVGSLVQDLVGAESEAGSAESAFVVPEVAPSKIANPALTEQEARDIAQDLINAEQCCLDEGYSMRLQGVAASCTDLLPGGRLHKFGELLSYQKPLNAEIEDNFARHQSCARSARGKPVGLAANCSKHILAELKTDHVRRQSQSGKQHASRLVDLDGGITFSPESLADWARSTMQLALGTGSDALPLVDNAIANDPSRPATSAQGLAAINASLSCATTVSKRKRKRPVEDIIQEIEAGATKPSQNHQVQKRKKKHNGWTLHLANTWKQNSRRAGESKRSRARRVLAQAHQSWHAAWHSMGCVIRVCFQGSWNCWFYC
ncbi:Uncharacterized protein SCF082_LOCUS33440 [Durusdinium trenchii]|uniref:Ribosome biogenesis regulatory protein n=1 Tax=Durusdinium trenchii TaxID=1381693 RepID=A0ABP0NQ31_9DINO